MEAYKTRGFIALTCLLVVFASVAVCEGDGQCDSSDSDTSNCSKASGGEQSTDGGGSECDKDGQVCYNCTTAQFCVLLPNGEFFNAGAYSCADQDPKKPYCNQGVCSATPNTNCSHSDPFVCTGSGYFPDPDDCQKFHFCVGKVATTYPCSENYVYSHDKTACIRRKVSTDCAVIKCTYAVMFEYVVYPKDPNVYGLCIRGQPTVMLKCREGEQFDIKTSQCKFVCKREGLFPVQGDNTKYRECTYNSLNRYEYVDRKCPDGSIFDSAKERCVIE